MAENNPYNVLLVEDNLSIPFKELKDIYDLMPKTVGCDRCPEVNPECIDWCCKEMCPSMFYTEFLYIWQDVQSWENNKKVDILINAMKCYLDSSMLKKCVFYHDKDGCLVYDKRPMACRMYGIMPKETFDQRYKALKEKHGDQFEGRPQCELVSVADGEEEVTAEKDDAFFAAAKMCDLKLGIQPYIVDLHDLPGGPYRTFYDHILMQLFDNDFLDILTRVRLKNPDKDFIDNFSKEIINHNFEEKSCRIIT